MGDLLIGFDIGGTNLKLGIFNQNIELQYQANRPNRDLLEADVIFQHMYDLVVKLLEENGLSMNDVQAIGAGVPGQMDLKKGLILSAPNLPFKDTPFRQMMQETFNKPCDFDNDANLAAWGEFVAGAAKDTTDMVFLTLGTGIGGGIICEGTLLHGFSDEAAELGHVIIYPDGDRVCGCGQRGCAEAYASAKNTAARANEALAAGAESSLAPVFAKKGRVTCREVFNHAKQGDALALEIVDETAKVLGLLCVSLLHITQPEKIVFSGGMIAAGDFLLEKIKAAFKKYVWNLKHESLKICFSTLGEDAGIYGAAVLAKRVYAG